MKLTRTLTIWTPDKNQSELPQRPLLEPEQNPYRLTSAEDKQARIDKLVKMADKHLEQQLLAEGLLKCTEVFAYIINQPLPFAERSQPMKLLGWDSEAGNHQSVEKPKPKIPQTLGLSRLDIIAQDTHTNSKPLPRCGVSRRSNQTQSEKKKYYSTTYESAEEYPSGNSYEANKYWNVPFF